jgi:hypothetical protein
MLGDVQSGVDRAAFAGGELEVQTGRVIRTAPEALSVVAAE